jgi:hypothetical protein
LCIWFADQVLKICAALLVLGAIVAGTVAGPTLKLRVTDSYTHVALSEAGMFLRDRGRKYQRVGTVTNGYFVIEFTKAEAPFQFELKAEGYGTFQSREFEATNGLPLFDVEMDRQFDFEGTIISPTGLPAAGALYFLCTDPTEVTFRRDRTFFTRSRSPSEAGAKGRFRLSPELTAHSVLVAHDLGYAQRPLAGWTNGGRIQLKPWGRVAGQMRINGSVCAKERVTLTASAAALGRTKMTLLDFSAVTDEQGHFAFENVPPVEVILSWQMALPEGLVNSQGRPLIADADKTSDVLFDLRGRTISGTFRINSKPAAISATLTSKPREVPLELWKAGSGLQSTEFRQTIAVIAKPDLTFRAVAVPPGEYVLEAQLFDKENARQSYAILRAAVAVPNGEGVLDLGALELRGD